MSIARPAAVIRRAASLPIDRIERFDEQLNSGLESLDESLMRPIRVAADQFTSMVFKFVSHSDALLNRSLNSVDRTTTVGNRYLAAVARSSIALVQWTDDLITSGFDAVDQLVGNGLQGARSFQVKFLELVQRTTNQINQGIESWFTRIDYRLNSLGRASVQLTKTASTFAVATLGAIDGSLTHSISSIDFRVNKGITHLFKFTASTKSLLNNQELAFDKIIEHGISLADLQIATNKARVISAANSINNRVSSTDLKMSGALVRIDSHLDVRISKANQVLSKSSAFTSNAVVTIDASLNQKLSRIDSRTDSFIGFTHGSTHGSANRPISSLPWAATSLTLVLGTLGAAAGASTVNADSITTELDTSVKIEATAAKDAVAQYLTVRDSFKALQASRSRTIQTLEQEIATAQARMTSTSLDGNAIIDVADNYGGVPYVRGGTTPRGFDCSGYTSYVFAKFGVDLPRTSAAQHAWADKVKFEDRKIGDLMFWSDGGGVHHVAIYAGNGMMWDSPRPGRQVGKTKIWGKPTYGRVPLEAINAAALEEVSTKKAALEELKAQAPKLEIKIDTQNFSSSSN